MPCQNLKRRTGLKSSTRHQPNAFTLTETLCALFCALLIFQLSFLWLQQAKLVFAGDDDRMEQFAIVQLRLRAAAARSLAVEEEHLMIEESLNQKEVLFHNGRLVMTPGYEVLMERIENALFEREADQIWLVIERKGKSSRWQIA